MSLVTISDDTSILKKLDDIDWDFVGEKTQYLTHKFHSYPARFIPQIPKKFIELFTNKGDTVLDPMCGSGTTLVEALLSGRNAIGNDYNPLAVLISKVKTTLIKEKDFDYLEQKIRSIDNRQQATDNKNSVLCNELPGRKLSKLFLPVHLKEITLIKQLIEELEEENKVDLRDFCKVGLSSTIWSFIESEGQSDVMHLFLRKIQLMKKEIMELNSLPLSTVHCPLSTVHCSLSTVHCPLIMRGDSRNLTIDSNSIDLIVTSPPYVNALDYYREHMYNMHFLGIDVNEFKRNEIGGHSHFISNRFRLLSEYLGDMLCSMIEMNRVLKKGKYCVIVVGNSSLEYELIESHKFFASFAPEIGFQCHRSIFRNIDKSKKYTSKEIGQIDDEYILVLEKITNSHANDNNFICGLVKEQMVLFKEQITKSPGSSIRGKSPSNSRLQQNVERIEQAIKLIEKDIKRN